MVSASARLPLDLRAPRYPLVQRRLANGLRVVAQPDSSAPLLAALVCYPGSRRDPARRSGFAHVCEHLAFDGPRDAPGGPYPARVEQAGGACLAVTTSDRLCFSSIVPRREFRMLLALEAERMARPLACDDAAALDVQRRVVLAELHERSATRTRAMAFEALQRLLFAPGHGYHRPAAGDAGEVQAVSVEDLEAHAPRRFAPTEAVLVLVGDVVAEEALDAVDEAFGHLSPATSLPQADDSAVAPGEPGSARRPAPLREPQVYVAWAVGGQGSDDACLAALLARALGQGRSSPLALELVERAGVAREVNGHFLPMQDASILAFSASAARDVDSERLMQSLLQALRELAGRGASPESLARARKKAVRDFYFATQSFERRADLCASYVGACGAPERLTDEPRRLLDAPHEALTAFAARLVQGVVPARLTLVPAQGVAA